MFANDEDEFLSLTGKRKPAKILSAMKDMADRLVKAIEALRFEAKPEVMVKPEIRVETPEMKAVKWTFQVKRDKDGKIETITATPHE